MNSAVASHTRSESGRHRRQGNGLVIQPPPTDEEKYAYINRSLPYLATALVIGFLSVTVSQILMELHVVAALTLVVFTGVYALYQLISLPINFTGRSFNITVHMDRVANWRPASYPVVDIYLPICGESAEVLYNTWTAVADLIEAYPGTALPYVLDDGADATARALAESFGFTYVIRSNRGWYRKAGNLRYAFERTSGDFFMILDADFAPRPDFLAETLPYFDDPDVAIVQTPQFFRTTPQQTWVERSGAAIQEVFYRSIQVARDRYAAAICVGTCAVYRREALEPYGGPALIAYAEDVHTGLNIHKDGKKLVYVPVNVATGMCPDSVHSFVHQQVRWCTGNMFTVILSRLWTVPMTLRARLSHISGFCYYLSSALAVFTVPAAPIVLLIFAPRSIRLSNLILFGPSLWTGLVMYPLWHRSDYWLRDVLPLTIIRGWAHVLAIWDYVRGRTLTWQPSGASVSRVRRLWWGLIIWNGGIALTWLGLTAWRIDTTRSLQFLITAVTGLLYATVAGRAIYAMRERGQSRERLLSMFLSLLARKRIVAGTAGAAIVLVAVCAVVLARLYPGAPVTASATASPHAPATATQPPRLLGMYAHGMPHSWAPVMEFEHSTGAQINVALYYNGWGEKFQATFAKQAYAHGSELLIDLDPSGHKDVQQIASGQGNTFLRTYARAVRSFGHPVILSFGHEMNGTWYSWGAGHITPAEFVAAWRQVVRVFRAAGASNVTWMWTVTSTNAASAMLRQWWPGASYVNWVGIDGYYYRPTDTFTSVFGKTISQVRKFSSDPILISETAVGPIAGPGKIAELFNGIRREHLLGLVWFDQAQQKGIYHQDWRLEDDPAMLAAFRHAVTSGK